MSGKITICSLCGEAAPGDHPECKEKELYNIRNCRRKGKSRYQRGRRMNRHNQ